jgi:SAM-dependent methyltransferase
MATGTVYDSPRMAAGYAFDRPPVHQHVVRAIGEHLRLTHRVTRALDIGCGAGLSTAALEPLARFVVGLEPVPTMLIHRRTVAPRAASWPSTISRRAGACETTTGSTHGMPPSSSAIRHSPGTRWT